MATTAFLAFAQADSWQTHHDAVRSALARKQYDVAVREAKAGLDSVAQNGPSDPRYIRSLMDQADTQRNDVAVDTLRRALESAESAGALAKDPVLGDELRSKLGQMLVVLVRDSNPRPIFRDVENYMRQALAVIAGLSKNQNSLLLSAMSSLGFALGREGYDVAAEAVFRRGLAVREDASLLSDLAEVEHRQGYLADAEVLLQRAIDLDARNTPAGGAKLSDFERLYRLAVLNIEREQYSVAEALLGQARQSGYGTYVEIRLNHALGNLACARRQFDSAKDRFRQAMAASQDPGWGYPRGQILIDMGRCAIKEKDFESAGASLQAAKSIFDAGFQRVHPAVAHILWQQALLLEAQKKTAEAEPLLTRAISILETAEGWKAPIVGAALRDLARVRKTTGQAAAAEELLVRARAIPRSSDVLPLPVVDKDLTPAKAAELAYWDSIQNREDAALFRQYLTDFPKGQFTAIASQHSGQTLPAGAPCPQDFEAVPEASLNACLSFWLKTGYGPVALAAYEEVGRIFFVGAFQKGNERLVTYLLPLDEFEQRLDINRQRGYRPATITVLAGRQGPRFTATWVKLQPGVSITTGVFGDAIHREFEEQTALKKRNTVLAIYSNRELRYVAVWEPSGEVDSRIFLDVVREEPGASLSKPGYGPTNIVPYQAGTEVRYAAVWTKNAGPWQASRGGSKNDYLKARDQLVLNGYSLAYVQVLGEKFCAIWHKPGKVSLAATAQADFSKAFNGIGIVSDGKTFTGGLDGVGFAYSGSLLQGALTFNNVQFQLGAADKANVVSGAGNAVELPAGKYSSLLVLATAVNGAQLSQPFKVAYSDGSNVTFTQSLSDWFTPKNYSGELTALTMPYRDVANGARDNRPFALYQYTFNLDNSKTVSSIQLPANTHVKVFAIGLRP